MAKPGRRPIDPNDRSVYVGVTLPGRQFDEFAKQAIRENLSIPAIIRRELDAKKTKNQTS